LLADPAKFSALQEIYENSSYYAGWYLREVEGNLSSVGSTPAEQNHSSVCAHLGDGATWQIAEQVSKLLRRQQEQGKQRNEKEALENARSHRYKSRFKNQTGVDDVLAKKCLSMKAYTRFIASTLKPSTSLQCRTDVNGSISVWPAGRLETDNNDKVIIPQNERCPCMFRVKWNALCKHEYKVDGKLNLDKFSRRWLNRTGFESRVLPSLSITPVAHEVTNLPTPPTDMLVQQARGDGWHDMGFNITTTLDSDDLDDICDENCAIDLCNEEEEDQETNTTKLGRLSYQSVKANCEEMCRYVQNDQLQLAELKLLTDRILSRLRNRQNIHASFADSLDSITETTQNKSMFPKSAVGRIVSNPKLMKRKRSKEEYFKRPKFET
jgi:hypothetical protein